MEGHKKMGPAKSRTHISTMHVRNAWIILLQQELQSERRPILQADSVQEKQSL